MRTVLMPERLRRTRSSCVTKLSQCGASISSERLAPRLACSDHWSTMRPGAGPSRAAASSRAIAFARSK